MCRDSPPTRAAVVLDGVFVYRGLAGETPFDVNALATGDMAGIEFYSGGATMPRVQQRTQRLRARGVLEP